MTRLACLLLHLLMAGTLRGEVPSRGEPSGEVLAELRRDIDGLKGRYRALPIMQFSPDQMLFDKIGAGARYSDSITEELIDLTFILELPPFSEEKLYPLDYSPAGRQLAELKSVAASSAHGTSFHR